MLLIGPVSALKELAIPAVVAVVGLSSSGSRSPAWIVPAVLGLLVFGFIPWFSTTFRITGTQFQLRKGLLNKEQLTAPLDRIRSVDLESSVLHRMLGLAKVQIGTGVDDTRIELNALSHERAESLRRFLLARTARPGAELAPDAADNEHHLSGHGSHAATQIVPAELAPAELAPVELASVDWTWLRFAPLSLGRLVLLAGLFGLLSQAGDNIPLLDWNLVEGGWRWLRGFALLIVIIGAFTLALVGWLIVSIGGYVVQWWNLRLVREAGSIRLSAGLLTTRSTSIEEQRVRGVELAEPLLLRLAGGAELSALATGVGSGGTITLLPPCPATVAKVVGETILDLRDPRADLPLSVALTSHGPAALRRCLIRAQGPSMLWLIAGSVLVWFEVLPAWVYVACLLPIVGLGILAGRAAYRHLGHAITAEHLLAGAGVFERRRTALELDGVIGWVIEQSVFQRRVGLANLIATTAAGDEKVVIRDLHHADAVAFANQASPGLLRPFLTH